MKLRKNRRGFTIVELVIVVAVIGVLAAVLIPTFINLTNKANKASDNSLVANLNTALAGREGEADDTANHTMQDAIDDLEVWGYKLTNLVTKSKEKLLWNEKTNRFLLEDDQLVKNSSTPEQFWQIADSIPATQKFSLLAGNKWNGTSAEGLTVGFDIGAHKEIQTVSYVGTNKNVSFRTVGGKLNIGTSTARSDGEIRSYGSADKVTVYTAEECFYSHSVISYMDLKEGKAIASTNGVIYLMKAAENTIVAEEDNGVVIIPTSATSDDIQTNVSNLPTGYSFDENGHIVQPDDIEGKIAENKGLLGSGTESDPFQVYDYDTMQAISILYEVGYFNFKVNIARTNNGTINCGDWRPVNINGLFDGNGVKFVSLNNYLFWNVGNNTNESIVFKNFDIQNCNIVLTKSAAAVARNVDDYGCKNLTLENINISGYIEGQGQTASFVAYPGSGVLTFKNCTSNAKVVAIGDCAAGFVVNPYMMLPSWGGTSDSKIVLDNSYFEGTLATTIQTKYKNEGASTWAGTNAAGAYVYAHNVSVVTELVNEISSKKGLHVAQDREGYHKKLWYDNSKVSAIVANSPSLDLSGVNFGETFTMERYNSSVAYATISLIVSPNNTMDTGSFTGTYFTERVDVTSETFSSSLVKKYNVAINGSIDGTTTGQVDTNGETGITSDGTTLNIVNSYYGHTHNGAAIIIVQYNSLGDVIAYTSNTYIAKTTH